MDGHRRMAIHGGTFMDARPGIVIHEWGTQGWLFVGGFKSAPPSGTWDWLEEWLKLIQ